MQRRDLRVVCGALALAWRQPSAACSSLIQRTGCVLSPSQSPPSSSYLHHRTIVSAGVLKRMWPFRSSV